MLGLAKACTHNSVVLSRVWGIWALSQLGYMPAFSPNSPHHLLPSPPHLQRSLLGTLITNPALHLDSRAFLVMGAGLPGGGGQGARKFSCFGHFRPSRWLVSEGASGNNDRDPVFVFVQDVNQIDTEKLDANRA